MRLGDATLIFLFLVLAFGGEILAFQIIPPRPGNVALNLLPFAVFFTGLALAFWVARRHHRRSLLDGKPAGFYCAVCGYDLRATPERCPECGGVRTGTHLTPMPRPQAMTQAVMKFAGIALVAVIAAIVIMMHVQLRGMPVSGH